jgi:biotin carboxylase
MYVILIAPGYPPEMPYFVRGLAAAGAQVLGVADQAEHELPEVARQHLAGYLRVPSLLDEGAVVDAVRRWASPVTVERVECLWEPGVLLAAKIREAVGARGMTLREAIPFRDKDEMKRIVGGAGIRVPRHARATSAQACREAARRIGFPIIIKPIAGAGSQDTYRVNDDRELEGALARLGHVEEANVEEFIDGEEFTFDTICVDGNICYFNIAWYRPRPLIARSLEWVSPQTICLRDPFAGELAGGREMGQAVLRALNFRDGFTHMEWYKKSNGEVVFGEIAARPPGAHTVDTMNYASDIDLFAGWGEAMMQRRFSQRVERKYNAAIVFKRAQGQGRIQRIEGLDRLMARFGEHVAAINILPVGAPRRNWIQTLVSDGWIVVRHPDLKATMDMADAVGTDLQLYAA